jgi:peptide subunit release factor 1 (eRF1)
MSRITFKDLGDLQETRAGAGRVLSVYLDVDQSRAANLNRGFERAFDSQIKMIARRFEEEYEAADFARCVEDIRKLLSTYEPRGRSLVVFARSAGPLWFREVNVEIGTEAHWGSAPYVHPLVEVLDEFETYIVVVANHARSRVYTVRLGAIEKHAEIRALGVVRHLKAAGSDHLYSQSHIQRKADENVGSHFKRVVEILEHVMSTGPASRLVLAGNADSTGQLFRMLPKSIRSRVAGSAVIAASASEKEILERTMALAGRAERVQELEKMEGLITSAAKDGKAVVTLSETLKAFNARRIRELVYAEGFSAEGGVCENCRLLFASYDVNCEICGIPVKPVEDLVEELVSAVLAEGASVEQLRGPAAEKLRDFRGIGAFLRF